MLTASPLYWGYLIALCLSVILALGMIGYVWPRRSAPGAWPLIGVLVSIMFWAGGYIIEYASPSLDVKLFSANISYIGMMGLPVMLFVFALHFTNRGKWMTPRMLALFFIIPAITLILQWTKDYHSLIYYNSHLIMDAPFLLLGKQYGIWFWVSMFYNYSLMISSVFVLVHRLLSPPRLFTDQVIYLLIGIVLPFFANFTYIFNLLPIPHSDWTPCAFTVSSIALALAITRHGFLEVLPVARDSAIELMSEGFLVLDDKDRVVDFNHSMQEIMGGTVTSDNTKMLTGKILDQLKLDQDYCGFKRSSTEIALTIGQDARTYIVHFSPLRTGMAQTNGHILVFHDITERKRMEDTIKHFAFYDPLTGLPNRLLFNDRAEHALSSASRYGRKVAVMVMDIDHFKLVNDTYGHSAGDQVLQDMALRFTSSVRKVDTVSRLGGDEFVVLLPEIPDENMPATIAQRIIDAMSLPFVIQEKDITLSVSIGISLYPEDADDLNLLVKYADRAMYHAKRNGCNNYQRYTAAMITQPGDRPAD